MSGFSGCDPSIIVPDDEFVCEESVDGATTTVGHPFGGSGSGGADADGGDSELPATTAAATSAAAATAGAVMAVIASLL